MSVETRVRAAACSLMLMAMVGCGDAARNSRVQLTPGTRGRAPAAPRRRGSRPIRLPSRALVTAEGRNRLYAVDLSSGRIDGTIALPADPENVVVQGLAVVVSSRSAAVTIVNPRRLRALRVIHGFARPHIPAISPDGRYAYITDDARGTLTAIRLSSGKVLTRIAVGAGAHHLSFRPDGRRLWIALGESARTIVILDTSDLARPRVIGRFEPDHPVHDLAFSPDGQRVWLTSASGPEVEVFNATDRHLQFRVPVGAAPQHVAFSGRYAYLTSGYGGSIEKVALATGRLLRRTRAPYGSFELDAVGGYVTTSSLLSGTVAIYNRQLALLRRRRPAQATRDVAIVPVR